MVLYPFFAYSTAAISVFIPANFQLARSLGYLLMVVTIQVVPPKIVKTTEL
jgi:hypothetical protein